MRRSLPLPAMTDEHTPPSRAPGSIARWGFFVVAMVLGTALLVSSITSYLGTSTLLTTVIRGQVQSLRRSLEQELREHRHGGPPSESQLARFVEEHADEGVLHVIILHPGGELAVQAGEGATLPIIEPDEMRVVGDLVQASFPLGRPPLEAKAPPGRWGPPPFGPPGRAELPPDGRPPLVVIELVPEVALALRARSRRDLGVGVTVAVALLLAAAVFWRLSRRAQLAEARLAAQRHLASLGEMSAVLAHEIRNPLASLKGHAQLLAERVEEEEPLRRKAGRILDETVRLELLTNGLLDFARTAALERREVELSALVRRCVEASEGAVEIDDAEAPARLVLDGPKIEQVLTNLLSNAHYAAPQAAAELRVASARGALVLEVRDHGPGVPAEERERIFEPFHTTRTRGTGLGLAVSRRIVEQHGGRIEVLDAEGGGACFRVTIPASHG